MKSGLRTQRLALAAFASFGLLALLPSTGWIVRQQMLLGAMLLPPRVSVLLYGDRSEARRAEVAHQRPEDVGMQVALAEGSVAALEALLPAMPNRRKYRRRSCAPSPQTG